MKNEIPDRIDIERGPYGYYVELVHGEDERTGKLVFGPKLLARSQTHVTDGLDNRYLIQWDDMEVVLL